MENRTILLRSTYDSEEAAAASARRLLERRVACCVHLAPVRSLYRWRGRVEDGTEWLLEARTTVGRRDDCWAALLDGHPYETPLVEVVAETQVTAPYARWAHRCVAGETTS